MAIKQNNNFKHQIKNQNRKGKENRRVLNSTEGREATE
jgi:hypothetical protein